MKYHKTLKRFPNGPPKEPPSKVHEIKTEEEFHDHIKNAGNKPVVAVFSARWCGPCNNMRRRLNEISVSYESQATILKIDVDDLSNLAMFEFQVSAMPTIVFFKNGQVVDRFEGANLALIEELIKKFS